MSVFIFGILNTDVGIGIFKYRDIGIGIGIPTHDYFLIYLLSSKFTYLLLITVLIIASSFTRTVECPNECTSGLRMCFVELLFILSPSNVGVSALYHAEVKER